MMVSINQGQLSTVAITVIVIVFGVIVTQPELLKQVMGDYYAQYGALILALIIAVWNYLKPRAADQIPEENNI